MNWGKWIIVSFVLFAGFIVTLVVVCVREDIGLVSKDYYQEEIAYQDQLERISNANELVEKPLISVRENEYLKVAFNDFDKIEKAELELFCPSNAKLDKTFNITASNEKEQYFSLGKLPKGMYRARMQWTMSNKEFYIEEVIHL